MLFTELPSATRPTQQLHARPGNCRKWPRTRVEFAGGERRCGNWSGARVKLSGSRATTFGDQWEHCGSGVVRASSPDLGGARAWYGCRRWSKWWWLVLLALASLARHGRARRGVADDKGPPEHGWRWCHAEQAVAAAFSRRGQVNKGGEDVSELHLSEESSGWRKMASAVTGGGSSSWGWHGSNCRRRSLLQFQWGVRTISVVVQKEGRRDPWVLFDETEEAGT